MAQLVKLQDYISRYEADLARYPTQFIRLKKGQWERVKQQWQTGEEVPKWEHFEEEQEQPEKQKVSFFKKIFGGKQTKQEEVDIESLDVSNELMNDDEVYDEELVMQFEPNIVYSPKTLEELKKMYVDQFFHFQMKWASSTLREKSYVDPKYMRDTFLRVLLQTLPDNYLIFYYPILQIKKAPVEVDVIIMTPTECICVTVLDQEDQAVYVADGERFWTKKVGKNSKRLLNPLIQLNRMESILSQQFVQTGIEMPIKKVLLSRNGYFDYPGSVFGVQFVDHRKFPEWMNQLRHSSTPMKHMQMRAAQTILKSTQTTSFHRDIWNTEKPEEEEQ